MMVHKLRSGVGWQRALEQKGTNQMHIKQKLPPSLGEYQKFCLLSVMRQKLSLMHFTLHNITFLSVTLASEKLLMVFEVLKTNSGKVREENFVQPLCM
jgi:hypothetical protein